MAINVKELTKCFTGQLSDASNSCSESSKSICQKLEVHIFGCEQSCCMPGTIFLSKSSSSYICNSLRCTAVNAGSVITSTENQVCIGVQKMVFMGEKYYCLIPPSQGHSYLMVWFLHFPKPKIKMLRFSLKCSSQSSWKLTAK